MRVEGPAKEAGPDGVAERATLLRLKFEIGFIGAEFHGLATAVEFKCPRPGDNGSFEFELSSQSRPDGTDAFHRLMTRPFGIDQGGVQSPDGDGRFVDHVHNDHDDVFVIVIDFHFDRRQVGVQRTCSGAVLITHVGSPVRTDGRLYFNGLLQKDALSAVGDGFRRGGTSPQPPPCGASHRQKSCIRKRSIARCRCPGVRTTAVRESG